MSGVFGARVRRLAVAVAAVLTVAGCAGGESDSVGQSSSTTIPASITAALPAQIRHAATLRVATSTPFGPIVYTDVHGRLVGFDVDVVTEVARTLGLRPEFRQTTFPAIFTAVADGTADLGARGIFDTLERERDLDFITYFNAGTQWAQRAGGHVDPDNACGLRVAVDDGTTQHRAELPAKSEACTALGDKAITAVPFETQAQAIAALVGGDVDALSADSPVTAAAVKDSGRRLAVAGDIFDAEPYAFAVKKGSALGPVLAQTITHLIQSGRLAQIAAAWGLSAGMIDESKINGATS